MNEPTIKYLLIKRLLTNLIGMQFIFTILCYAASFLGVRDFDELGNMTWFFLIITIPCSLIYMKFEKSGNYQKVLIVHPLIVTGLLTLSCINSYSFKVFHLVLAAFFMSVAASFILKLVHKNNLERTPKTNQYSEDNLDADARHNMGLDD